METDNYIFNRKRNYLLSYRQQKMRLRRLKQQREEYLYLRGKANNLGTTITRGQTSDETGEAATRILDIVDRIDFKIDECYKALSEILAYIERSDTTEKEKLILTCRFVKDMSAEQIALEIEEPYRGRGAMRKRIKRIVDKLPEIKNTPSI